MLSFVMLSVVMLNALFLNVLAPWNQRHDIQHHDTQSNGNPFKDKNMTLSIGYRYAVSQCSQLYIFIAILSAIMNVAFFVMLSVLILSFIMLIVTLLILTFLLLCWVSFCCVVFCWVSLCWMGKWWFWFFFCVSFCRLSHFLLLCWMSLCWVSLCQLWWWLISWSRISQQGFKARDQFYKTFCHSNLLPFHGIAVILLYKATLVITAIITLEL